MLKKSDGPGWLVSLSVVFISRTLLKDGRSKFTTLFLITCHKTKKTFTWYLVYINKVWLKKGHFIEHQTNSNIIFWTSNELIYWCSNSNTLFLASNDWTSNSNLIGLSLDLLKNYSLNWLKLVHLLVIQLEHPIFGFEWSYIELRTLFDPSLFFRKSCSTYFATDLTCFANISSLASESSFSYE